MQARHLARRRPNAGGRPQKQVPRPYAGQAEMYFYAFRARTSVGRALGPHALSGECPPASACGRPLPLYFASKGMGPQRPTHRQRQKSLASPAYREPSPVAAGRLLGKIKEEAAMRPGDMCARGLPVATGPSRSRPARSKTPADPNDAGTPGHARNVVLTPRRSLQHDAPLRGAKNQKKTAGLPRPFSIMHQARWIRTCTSGSAASTSATRRCCPCRCCFPGSQSCPHR